MRSNAYIVSPPLGVVRPSLRRAVPDVKPPWSVWDLVPFNWVAVDLLDQHHEGSKPHEVTVLNSLTFVYNVIAFVEALLLAVGMTPFVLLGDWFNRFGYSPAFIICSLALIGMMGTCLLNLLVILACLTFLNGIPPPEVKDTMLFFPVFGMPIYLFVGSILNALVYTFAWMSLFLPLWYTWFFIGIFVIHFGPFIFVILRCFRKRHTDNLARPAQRNLLVH
jgi:hypothetical protein